MSSKLETFLSELRELASPERPFHVIYLDDEEEALEVIEFTFRQFGLECLATTSPEQALDWVRKYQSSLLFVVSDYSMGAMTGFDFRKAVLEITASVPFAIYSGHVDTEMALRGIEHKISGFLDKPLEQEQLTDLLVKEGSPRLAALREEREFLRGFTVEAEDLIEQAEELILELDGHSADQDVLNRFFGMIHTLKGASSFFEPKHLHRFAHDFEDTLKQVQRGERSMNEQVTTYFLSCLDVMKELVAEFKSGEFKVRRTEDLIAEARAQLSTEVSVGPTAATPETSADHPAETKAEKPRQSEIRVAMSTLDEFMQLSGEMTMVRNMLNKSLRALETQYPGDREIANLAELLGELHKVNGTVQAKVTDLRKVSVRNTLKTLPRAVRDIAKTLAKDVELNMIGEQLRVDTSIAEILSNSLLHVVKNSLDHGIELPDVRVAAGKPACGRITISCTESDEQVIVEVEDDGRGIAADVIRAKMRASGTPESEIARMSETEIHAMIFAAGFSTARQVTDISGRGVGMSMVKSVIEGAGGNIKINSREGQGTRFTFTIPIPKSVLISNCLFVRAGAQQFGIMQDEIARFIQVVPEDRADKIASLEGSPCLRVDDQIIPILDLGCALGARDQDQVANRDKTLNLVLIGTGEGARRVAFSVDEIADVEDTVIKPLPPQFNPHQFYRGATFMNDGTPGLILNAAAVMDRAAPATPARATQAVGKFETAAVEHYALIFKLDAPGLYAVPRELIFRVETFDASLGQPINGVRMQPYRGRALPVLDLRSYLYPGAKIGQEAPTHVVIVSSGEHQVGFAVTQIVDLTSLQPTGRELPLGGRFIAGQVLWRDQLVNQLDWPALLSAAVTKVPEKASA